MYPLNDTEEEEQPSGQQCAGPLPRQPPAGADQHRHVQLQPAAAHPRVELIPVLCLDVQ